MKENYVRGFKDALEWVMHTVNSMKTLEDLIKKINDIHNRIDEHHIANIEEQFQ